jgi:peptidyl-prolyl cis-trans isomerase SurA
MPPQPNQIPPQPQLQEKHWIKLPLLLATALFYYQTLSYHTPVTLLRGCNQIPAVKCQILQSLLTQKLLAQQAVIDSIDVKDDDIDASVDRRMREMMQRAGGQDKLEAFLGRSIIQYKDEIRPDMKEQMIAQRMQQKITEKLNVTPQDVKDYFNKMAKDSLPSFNKEVEVGEIVFQPKLTKEEKQLYKEKPKSYLPV